MTSGTPIIELADVHKVYATGAARCRRCAASSLAIDPGEFVAVMGPSGLGQVDPDAHPRLPRRPDRPARYHLAGEDVERA